MKTNIKIIIGVVVAILVSVSSCYVLAESLINSKDVVYEDNSNLMADNVQDAIDGTCSKIDTRLAGIEDKLYTVKDMSYNSPGFTSSTAPIYTGTSITFPAKSYCGVVVTSVHSTGSPKDVFLSTSKDELRGIIGGYDGSNDIVGDTLYISFNEYVSTEKTYYVWASHHSVGIGRLEIKGFCATKYK